MNLHSLNPGGPLRSSFPHAFSGGSTVLTTGGMRIGPDENIGGNGLWRFD
jgi:hypothetical protein